MVSFSDCLMELLITNFRSSLLKFSCSTGDLTKNNSPKASIGVEENSIIGIGASSSDNGKANIVNALAANCVTPKANAKNKGGKYSEVI